MILNLARHSGKTILPVQLRGGTSTMTKKKTTHHPKKPTQPQAPSDPQPVVAQPTPSAAPTGFKDPVTDQSDQERANLERVREPAGGALEPILTLAQVYGDAGAAKTAAI